MKIYKTFKDICASALASASEKSAAAALFVFVLLLWGANYALRGYWEPDEARFVYVAREMLASESWLIPLRNGEFYAHKPPLMLWLIMLGERVFPEPFGSRLPNLIGAFLALWATAKIAALWLGRAAAPRAVVVLGTAWLFWGTAGIGQIDTLLLGLEMSALWILLRNDNDTPRRFPLPAFILLGFAVLAKGPVGLLVPLGIYAALRSCARRDPRVGAGRLALGALLAAAIPLAWVAACVLDGAPREYIRELIIDQNISRAAGALGHEQPPWYFLLNLPAAFLPWTLLLPAAWKALGRDNPLLLRKLARWTLFVLVFFSLSASKRGVYILAALPPMAIAIAAAWDALAKKRRTLNAAAALLALAALAAGIAALVFGGVVPIESLASPRRLAMAQRAAQEITAAPFALLFCALASGFIAMLRTRGAARLRAFAAALLASFALAGAVVAPSFNAVKEPLAIRPLAEKHIPDAAGRLLLYNINGETLALHAQRRGLRCDGDEALLAAMETQKTGLAIFLSQNTNSLLDRFPPITETGDFHMGAKHYIWAAFDAVGKAPAAAPIAPAP